MYWISARIEIIFFKVPIFQAEKFSEKGALNVFLKVGNVPSKLIIIIKISE